MKEETGEYRCEQCDEVWSFVPEDYESIEDWPIYCPLCLMPLWDMIKDIYKEEGALAVIKQIYLRYK